MLHRAALLWCSGCSDGSADQDEEADEDPNGAESRVNEPNLGELAEGTDSDKGKA